MASGAIIDVVTRFAGMFECTVATPVTTVRATLGTTAGELEFIVQNAKVSYDYMFVVEPGT